MAPTRSYPTELYRLYDAGDRLLYVGVSSNIRERLRRHAQARRGVPWWSEVSYCSLELFRFGSDALAAEVTAIKTESPLYNVRSVSHAA